jgi:multidrug resistance efflux pump
MEWLDILKIVLPSLIAGVAAVRVAKIGRQNAEHSAQHEREREITAARAALLIASAELTEYNALALKNGHANGELDTLRHNLREAETALKLALLR